MEPTTHTAGSRLGCLSKLMSPLKLLVFGSHSIHDCSMNDISIIKLLQPWLMTSHNHTVSSDRDIIISSMPHYSVRVYNNGFVWFREYKSH